MNIVWISPTDELPRYNTEVRILVADRYGRRVEDAMLCRESNDEDGTVARWWKVRGDAIPWKVTDSRVMAWHYELPFDRGREFPEALKVPKGAIQ